MRSDRQHCTEGPVEKSHQTVVLTIRVSRKRENYWLAALDAVQRWHLSLLRVGSIQVVSSTLSVWCSLSLGNEWLSGLVAAKSAYHRNGNRRREPRTDAADSRTKMMCDDYTNGAKRSIEGSSRRQRLVESRIAQIFKAPSLGGERSCGM